MNSLSEAGTQRAWNLDALQAISARSHRPILFTGARIMSLDPLIGNLDKADLMVVGPVIVGLGPGIVTAAGDDNAIVVDCSACVIVPAVMDVVGAVGARAGRAQRQGSLIPGAAADLIVVPGDQNTTSADALLTALVRPREVRALLANGLPVLWDGADVPGRPQEPPAAAPQAGPETQSRLGTWIDTNGFLHQHLLPGGRYDETRGGRPHAYQGRYWIDGNRIDYLDDLGFWAFGEFIGDGLHHAGYQMQRSTDIQADL